jgi:NCS1 family nucleobase:cation symporter-1
MDQLWDPVKLLGRLGADQPAVVAIAMFTVALATLSVNVAANVVSPANDFANAFPRFITFKVGGLITGLVGVLMQPWRLIADPHGYIFVWLQGYSGGLGSIAGVLIADYWILRKTKLELADLYLPGGAYQYKFGLEFCSSTWRPLLAVPWPGSGPLCRRLNHFTTTAGLLVSLSLWLYTWL